MATDSEVQARRLTQRLLEYVSGVDGEGPSELPRERLRSAHDPLVFPKSDIFTADISMPAERFAFTLSIGDFGTAGPCTEMVPKAAHAPFLSHPEQALSLILEFMDEHCLT